jgi:2-polyprenyl-3-methyl-5-hydroxy-6-metoxy-1,4-benzoquinol methylase
MELVRKLAGHAFFQLMGYRPFAVDAGTWDREYKSGSWDFLGAMDNLGGLASILGYCQYLNPDLILDIGCGAGLLARKLKVLPYGAYLGLDLSAEAIAQAAPVADDRTTFQIGDAESFDTGHRFDVIVFSQILNYVERPDAMLARYAGLLTANGRIIASLYQAPRTAAAWRLIDRTMHTDDAMTVTQGAGTTTTKVLRPRR